MAQIRSACPDWQPGVADLADEPGRGDRFDGWASSRAELGVRRRFSAVTTSPAPAWSARAGLWAQSVMVTGRRTPTRNRSRSGGIPSLAKAALATASAMATASAIMRRWAKLPRLDTDSRRERDRIRGTGRTRRRDGVGHL